MKSHVSQGHVSQGAKQTCNQRPLPGCDLGLPAQGKAFMASGVVFPLKNTSVKILFFNAGGA